MTIIMWCDTKGRVKKSNIRFLNWKLRLRFVHLHVVVCWWNANYLKNHEAKWLIEGWKKVVKARVVEKGSKEVQYE